MHSFLIIPSRLSYLTMSVNLPPKPLLIVIGINVEYHVARTHTQNGLVESLIKHLQLIARSLLMKTKLLTFSREHAIMNATSLVRIQPTSYQENPPSQLVQGKKTKYILLTNLWLCSLYTNCTYITHENGSLMKT